MLVDSTLLMKQLFYCRSIDLWIA